MKLYELKELLILATPEPWTFSQDLKSCIEPVLYESCGDFHGPLSLNDMKLIAAMRAMLPKFIVLADMARHTCLAMEWEDSDLNRALDALEIQSD